MPSRLLVFLANLLWFLGTLPEAIRFRLALRHPARNQRRLQRHLLRRNADSAIGRRLDFARTPPRNLPPMEYEDILPDIDAIRQGAENILTTETVRLLEPTGGTTGGTKLIPYTDGLRREYARAIAPWLNRLYRHHPTLLLGRQYWCITPATPLPSTPGGPPIGFAEDAEYLGGRHAALARRLLVAPAELRHIHDPDTFAHLTLLFLLAAPDLALISLWHPSFLTLLLDQLPRRRNALAHHLASARLDQLPHLPAELRPRLETRLHPMPARARQLAAAELEPETDLTPLWPRLRLVSCWAGNPQKPWVDRIRSRFPACHIEPKGLMATEGVATIPWTDGHLPAIRAHVLEFETDDGTILGLADLREGQEAAVLLTTSGGLYRYRTHDRVRAGKPVARTPRLQFLGRDNAIADLFGEKLDERHVQRLLASLAPGRSYRFLAPCRNNGTWHYALFAQPDDLPSPAELEQLERGLRENFHYDHARRLGQLGPLALRPVPGDLAGQTRARLVRQGRRAGDLKFPALHPGTDWDQSLPTLHPPKPPLTSPTRNRTKNKPRS